MVRDGFKKKKKVIAVQIAWIIPVKVVGTSRDPTDAGVNRRSEDHLHILKRKLLVHVKEMTQELYSEQLSENCTPNH